MSGRRGSRDAPDIPLQVFRICQIRSLGMFEELVGSYPEEALRDMWARLQVYKRFYPDHLPSTIPISVFIRQSTITLAKAITYILRLILVIETWLVILPSLNMFSLRSLIPRSFFTNPNGASNSPSMNVTEAEVVLSNETIANASSGLGSSRMNLRQIFLPDLTSARLILSSLKRWYDGQASTLVTFIFRGQVLTIILAASLVGMIFLREWILQHDWNQHLTKPAEPEEEINVNDWLVIRGIALTRAEFDQKVAAFRRVQEAKVGRKPHGKTKVAKSEPDMSTIITNRQSSDAKLIAPLPRRNSYTSDSPFGDDREINAESGPLKILRPSSMPPPTVPYNLVGEPSPTALPSIATSTIKASDFSASNNQLSDPSHEPLPHVPDPILRLDPVTIPITHSPPRYRPPSPIRRRISDDFERDPGFSRMITMPNDPTIAPSPPSTLPSSPLRRSVTPLQTHFSPDERLALRDTVRGDRPQAGPSSITIPAVRTSFAKARLTPEEKSDYDLNWQAPELLPLSGSKASPRKPVQLLEPDNHLWKKSQLAELPDLCLDPNQLTKPIPVASLPPLPSSLPSSPTTEEIVAANGGILGIHPKGLAVKEGSPESARSETPPSVRRSASASSTPSAASVASDQADAIDEGDIDGVFSLPLAQQEQEAANDAGAMLDLLTMNVDHSDDGAEPTQREPIGEAGPIAPVHAAPGRPLVGPMLPQPNHEDDEGDDDAEAEAPRAPQDMEDGFAEEQEMDALEREDWDGVLEVVGLIGPLHGLFQNLLFALIVMGAALCSLVAIPIIIGKLVLFADPLRLTVYTFHMVLRGVHVLTSPVLDISWEIVRDVLFIPAFSSAKALCRILGRELQLGQQIDDFTGRLGFHLPDLPTIISTEVDNAYPLTRAIGLKVVQAHESFRRVCLDLAASDHLSDQIWVLLAGYAAAFAFLLVIAMTADEHGGVLSATLAINFKRYVHQLSFFMILELAVFPFTVGIVINFFTVPLFPDTTITSRLSYFRTNPFGAMFTNLLVGTLFMFSFAGILAYLRSICRKGALFFIRDPADQNFSPVKDTIERPTGYQFRKLLTSAIMYSCLIGCIFGITCWGIYYQPYVEVLPLRTNGFEPLSSIPFDLLFLHIISPPLMEYLRPRARLRRLTQSFFRNLSSLFLLTPLIMSRNRLTRHLPLRGPFILERIVWPTLDFFFQRFLSPYDNSATAMRVPATDQVVLLPLLVRRKAGVFVPVDEIGRPKTDEHKLNLLKQDRAARKANRDPVKDYNVVWLPKYWRTRVHVFIMMCIWASAVVVAVGLFAPLLVGRAALRLLWEEKVHDGYSLITGAIIIHLAIFLGSQVQKRIIALSRAPQLRRSDSSQRFKRSVIFNLIRGYGVFMLYGIVPLLLGSNWEVYLTIPVRYMRDGGTRSVLHVWDAWATGVIICCLFAGISVAFPRFAGRGRGHHLLRLLRAPMNYSFRTVNTVTLPVLGYLLVPLILPWLTTAIVVPFMWYSPDSDRNFAFRLAFPCCLWTLLIYLLRRPARQKMTALRQKMIDAEYVLEERVENYVPSGPLPLHLANLPSSGDDEWEDIIDDDTSPSHLLSQTTSESTPRIAQQDHPEASSTSSLVLNGMDSDDSKQDENDIIKLEIEEERVIRFRPPESVMELTLEREARMAEEKVEEFVRREGL
ncbi:hypothetical protein M231_03974 [Tremella mesenterica]|uniref:RING-type E3 ubiquitin transferase n=1 Tax=Tremella mesenterica TaxID=5217 RepID=A0A4Q1BLW6_TREME|nr:hypothetical protein M231_03974 [Tremella mesenterica]